ncbi:hypothetical protein [Streptomyces europaeiscabiei]|nr:hypothetical protein [Streptomyces europaeiscabiei]
MPVRRHEHFEHISIRLAGGGPTASGVAVQGVLAAAGALLAVPFGEV